MTINSVTYEAGDSADDFCRKYLRDVQTVYVSESGDILAAPIDGCWRFDYGLFWPWEPQWMCYVYFVYSDQCEILSWVYAGAYVG